MSLHSIVNGAWQLFRDRQLIAHATADADLLHIVELRHKDGTAIDLAELLPAGWATNQDLSDPAKAMSAMAWRTDAYELAEAHEPPLLSRAGKGVRARYLSHVDLREKATGKVRRYGAAHAPLLATGRKGEWQRNLAAFLRAHPDAIVGGDGNVRRMRRLSKRLGRPVVGREVMFLALPGGGAATVTTQRVPSSDHPIVRALVRAPVPKEKPVSKVQIYPGADSTTQWFADAYPGTWFDANCGVIHSTETTGWPGYGGGKSAPNVTARPDFAAKRLRFRQHFPVDMSSRALQNDAGGVETNRLNTVQVELVGTCDPKHRRSWNGEGKLLAGRDYLYWPDAPDWALRDLGLFLRWCRDVHGVPAASPGLTWLRYPDSYGESNDNRMTFAEWRAFKGWCGHQHVPENDHGDPGSLRIARVLEFANTPQPGATAPKGPGVPAPKPLPPTELSRTRARMREWRKKLGNRPRVRAAVDAFLKGTPKR